MTNEKTLELRVRAQLEGVKDLKAVSDAITDIEKAIERQTAAAKRGENVYDELKASLESLVIVQKELKNQANLINEFQRLEKAITATESRVATATKRYEEYDAKLKAAGKVTDEQQQKLINYGKSLDAANAALKRQTEQRQAFIQGFKDAGIALDQLATVERQNLTLQANVGAVYQRNTTALKEYATNVRSARDAAKALNDERAFQNSLDDAAKLAKASQYASWWSNELDRVEAAQKKLAQDSSLRKTASDAEEAARGYNTLARAATTLVPKTVSLRDAVNAIIDPARSSRATLNGLEQEVNGLSATIGKINGPVSEYRATLDRLSAAQKALGQQASLIDDFRRQTESLRAARAEYVQARAQVLQYAEAVRQGGEAGQQFTRALSEAQSRARAAAQALAQQLETTRQSRDTLRQAGVATKDLNGAQQRMINVARQATTATSSLNAAVKQYGQETEKASKSTRGSGLFGDEGRTTLSLLQRIRGEVLSLTASYVGLFAVLNTARGAVDASKAREGIRNQLGISVGNDRAAIDEEYNYIKQQSDRIGLEFDRTAKGYAKFSAAATLAGRSRQEIRYIFETFSEVGRVANLSTEDLDGVFKALEQITSKGKIQAEELRGQLGDRLFGAFEIAAKALKDQFPDLDKALQKGEVTANQLVLIAEQYKKTIADQLPAATQSLAAQQARLNTALFDFKLAIGDSGFIDSFAKAVMSLTDFLRSDDGKRFADGLGQAFKTASDAAVVLFKNIENVKTIAGVASAVFAGMLTVSVLGSLMKGAIYTVEFATAIKGLILTVKGLTGAWGVLASTITAALGVIGAAFLGWEIGKWAREKFAAVRQAGTWMVTGLMEAFAWLKGGFSVALDALPAIARNVMRSFVAIIADAVRGALGIFSVFARAAGLDKLAGAVDDIANSLKVGYEDIGAATAKARQDLSREVANIRTIRNEMLAADLMQQNTAVGRTATQADVRRADGNLPFATPKPNTSPAKAAGPSEQEIEARKRKIESITRSLEALDAKIERSQTDTLSTQLAAIDIQYAKLKRDIAQLGGAEGARFNTQLDQLVADLRRTTTDKFNKGLLKDQQTFQNKIEDLESAAGKKQILNLEQRQAAIKLRYEDYYRELDELYKKFVANNRDTTELDRAWERLDAGVQELQNLEARKYAQEELNRRQERFNQIIKARDAQVEAVRAQRSTGSLDEGVAAEQINAINQAALPGIQAAAEATRLWAEQHKAIFATPEDFQIFLANLEAVRVKSTEVKTEWTLFEQSVISGAAGTMSKSIEAVADAFGKIVSGQQDVAQGFKGMMQAFGQFVAQFLRDIAIMILKLLFFKALQKSGNPMLMAIGKAGEKSMGFHSGGVVGSANTWTRSIDSSWFAGAPRYHTGGIVGLKPDEYPAILQRSEEVLAKDDPRNILNGGAAAGGAQGGGQGGASSGMRVVLVDDRTKIPEAMASAEGEQVIVQTIRRNIPTLKAMLRS